MKICIPCLPTDASKSSKVAIVWVGMEKEEKRRTFRLPFVGADQGLGCRLASAVS